jgi:hypothetical protein
MVKFRHIFFLITLLAICSGEINAQLRYSIRARIINSYTGEPVPLATIVNKNRQFTALSDTAGVFSMDAGRSDTLYISTIGFYPISVIVSDTLTWQMRIPEIKLKNKVYELASFSITEKPTYQQFKHKILQDVLPRVQDLKSEKTKIAPIIRRKVDPIPEYGISGALTALYMAFSKEGEGVRRAEKAKDVKITNRIINPKYNREIINSITGLSGNVLEEFMVFCQPSDVFLRSANDYDIYKEVFHCLDSFIESKNRN